MKSLEEIHELEKSEKWEESINALEERLKVDPLERESILRLSFLLWSLLENQGIRHHLDTSGFSKRASELFINSQEKYKDDYEYLFWFGNMIRLFPWCFSQENGKWKKIGWDLLNKVLKGCPENLWLLRPKRSVLIWYGNMIRLFPGYFRKEYDKWEKIGWDLLNKVLKGDPENIWVMIAKRSVLYTGKEYEELKQKITQEQLLKVLKGRGLLSSYYLGRNWKEIS